MIDPASLNHARKLLENAGFEITTCAEGLSALDLFKNQTPDIVLLSAMLPKMHGFEVCSAMRKLPAGGKVPIVIITDVYKGKRYRLDAIGKYGATEYIEKPVEDSVLVATLKNLSKYPSSSVSPLAESEDVDERTVQFNRDDLLAQLGQKMPRGVPKPASEKKQQSDKMKDDIARKLEKSLAGLDLNLSKRAKPKPKATGPVSVPAVAEKLVEPEQKLTVSAESPEAVSSDDGATFTSEDLFTDIIESVERELQSAQFPVKPAREPGTSPMPAAPAPTMAMKAEDVAKATEELASSFDSELEKKLTDTLSGLRKEVAAASAKTPSPVPDAVSGATVQIHKDALKEAMASAEALAAEKGINFGQYLLLEKIATGGMAELFKAKRKGVEGFEKILAIKRILPHMSDNEEFVTMFIDEAKLAAQLTHQNICQIFDLGKIENSYYIAMEYVHGKDLRAALRASRSKKKPFPVELAILVISKISSALDYAHRKRDAGGQPLNLVHRDISPQNILISYEGEVKLVDFGIAKAATKAHVTQHGALKGKLLYMSPEQAWGKAVDKRTDIFSLGVVLYEMLTGHPLFLDENDTEVTILEKVREARIGPVRELNSGVSAPLEKVIAKILHKNPEERYQTALDVQKDLDNLFYTEGYNATSGSLANFVQSLFPEDWNKEAGVKETVVIEKEISEALTSSLGAPAESPKKEEAATVEPAESARPKREGRIKIVPSAEKRIEPAALLPEPTLEPAAPVKSSMPVPTSDLHPAPPILFVPVEKRSYATYAAIAVFVILVGIAAAFLYRKEPAQEVANPPAQTSSTQTPAPSPTEPVMVPPTVSKENQKTQPTVTPPVEEKDKQAKIDELQKKVQEEEKILAKKKEEEEKKKAEALQKEEMAKLEAQQAPPPVQPEEQKSESDETPTSVEQESKPEESAVIPVPVEQQEAEPAPVQVEETPAKEEPEPAPAQVTETPQPVSETPAKPEVQEGELVELTPDIVKPVLVGRVNPKYPPVATAKKMEGTVLLSVLVSETGQVAEVKVIRGAGGQTGLNESAVSAVKQWKFTPAVKDGKRVKVWVTYPIVFKLQ